MEFDMPLMKIIPGFTKEQLQCEGVYAIVHKATGRMYIGETHSILGGRYAEHVALLNRNAHHCRPLQQDWNTQGADAFAFRILYFAPLACHNRTMAHEKWRAYLERKLTAEAPLIYNTRINPVPPEPPSRTPYTPSEK
jgi:hypothetical protein